MIWLVALMVVLLVWFLALALGAAARRGDDFLMEMRTPPAETPEAVKIETVPFGRWPVPLGDELQAYIVATAEAAGIDPGIVFAIIKAESQYQADVRGDGGESLGLMQIQPYWHLERMTRLGVRDLLDPYQNVTIGVDILAELLGTYDMEHALSYYNSGDPYGAPGYARQVQRDAETLREGIMVVELRPGA